MQVIAFFSVLFLIVLGMLFFLLFFFFVSTHIAVVAFIFLVAAALAQIAIPWLTGRAIDSVALGGSLRDNKEFTRSIELLTAMSVACGVCSGLRGCLFQYAEARLGFRLRKRVFEAVLYRDMAFFDETDTVCTDHCGECRVMGVW